MNQSNSPFRFFDAASLIDRLPGRGFSIGLHDYTMLTPQLSRVVLSYTGERPDDSTLFHEQISKLLAGTATPVVGSFSELTKFGEVKSIIGFVKAAAEVVPLDEAIEAQVKAGRYKAMASNLLMDLADKSMWEIKSGATGKYLAKQNPQDMSELMHLATASIQGIPRLSQVTTAGVKVKEFASFVDLDTHEVLHGFVVQAQTNEPTIKVYCSETSSVVEAHVAQLIEVNELDAQEATVKGMEMAPEVAADQSSPETLIAYYRKLFAYSPEYVADLIKMVGMHRFG